MAKALRTKLTVLLSLLFIATAAPLQAASNTFVDYQNFNHGYCPNCNCYPCRCGAGGAAAEGTPPASAPCAPQQAPSPCQPATVCATDCGISLCWIGLGIALVATAAALIIGANNGSASGR